MIAAPFFSPTRAEWVPCALRWHPDTGEFERFEGPEGFESYRAALEASRFRDTGEAGGWPMKRRRMGIVLVALCCVLALTSSAAAECAWMLWKQDRINIPPRPISVEWAAPLAFVDRAACMEWIDRNARQWEKNEGPGQSVTRSPGGMAAEFRTQSPGGLGSGITNSLFCLPDTVDPRGPKGK